MNQQLMESIYEGMKTSTVPFSIKEAFTKINASCDQKYVKFALRDLLKQGKVERISRGVYKITNAQGESFTFELMFGLEIEAEYNTDLIKNIEKSAYHSISGHKMLNTKWFCENDASLRRNKFARADTCEFISVPTPKSEIDKLLKSFQKSIWKKADGEWALSQLLNFNESTGAHIHISMIIHDGKTSTLNVRNKTILVNGTQKQIKFVPIDFMKKIGTKFKKAIKKDLPKVYPSFNKNYYRGYARKISDRTAYTARTTEFNYTTQCGTIEYRSPNLTGVTTWNDFFKFYEILTNVIQDAFDRELAKENPFGEVINEEIILEEKEEEVQEIKEIINIETEEEENVHY